MAIYYGVIRDNRVELEEGAHLAEGTRVAVYIAGDAATTRAAEEAPIGQMHAEGLIDKPSTDDAATEEMVKEQLRAAGILAPSLPPVDDDEDDDFEPITVEGEPLSEMIIRERR